MPKMPYTRLYLLVEGDDDVRFLERLVVPKLSSHYDYVQVWKYAERKADQVNAFLKSIRCMGAEYLFLGDLNSCACVPRKKEVLLGTYKNLEEAHALVVIKEIESWYMAGLKAKNPLAVRVPADTSDITREQFDRTMPRTFDSRVDYMIEILKHFDVPIAAKRNPSFSYFARRCGLLHV